MGMAPGRRRRFQGGPSLALDLTSGSLNPLFTFARSSSAAYFDNTGARLLATANTPRFNYDPATLQAKGLLIEEGRTNLLLNSLLDGTSLSTQPVTVTAVSHVLSFYGTGTVTLSGASTAGPLVGTGASNRVSLVFTPTAGTLTVTVTGSVKWAQLEVGAFVTSHIPTAGAAVARSPDIAYSTGASLASWFDGSQGTFATEFDTTGPLTFARVIGTNLAGAPAYINLGNNASLIGIYNGTVSLDKNVGGANTAAGVKAASCYNALGRSITMEGATPSTDANTMTAPATIYLGCHGGGGNFLNGHIKTFRFFRRRFGEAELQGITL